MPAAAPPLPPGFVLEGGDPPLPPGFVPEEPASAAATATKRLSAMPARDRTSAYLGRPVDAAPAPSAPPARSRYFGDLPTDRVSTFTPRRPTGRTLGPGEGLIPVRAGLDAADAASGGRLKPVLGRSLLMSMPAAAMAAKYLDIGPDEVSDIAAESLEKQTTPENVAMLAEGGLVPPIGIGMMAKGAYDLATQQLPEIAGATIGGDKEEVKRQLPDVVTNAAMMIPGAVHTARGLAARRGRFFASEPPPLSAEARELPWLTREEAPATQLPASDPVGEFLGPMGSPYGDVLPDRRGPGRNDPIGEFLGNEQRGMKPATEARPTLPSSATPVERELRWYGDPLGEFMGGDRLYPDILSDRRSPGRTDAIGEFLGASLRKNSGGRAVEAESPLPPGFVPEDAPTTRPLTTAEGQIPAVEPAMDRRTVSSDVPTENRIGPRRRDVVTRERWDTMTPEEQKAAYFTSDKTGLPNSRVFEAEHDPAGSHPHVGYYDLDDFKAMNTAITHEGVDQVALPTVGHAMSRVAESMGGDVVPYHRSGDEFLFRAKTPEAGNEFAKRVNAALADTVFTFQDEAGNVYERKGAGGSHGIGTDTVSAERAAAESKAARRAAGLRTGFRDEPVSAGAAKEGTPADLGPTAGRPGVPGYSASRISAEVHVGERSAGENLHRGMGTPVDVSGGSRPAVPYGQEAAPAAPSVAPRAAQPGGGLPGQAGGPGGVREDLAGGGREPATHGYKFVTAKGSTYEFADQKTTRTKAARPEHGSDSGLKARSDLTVFVDPGDAQKIGTWNLLDAGSKRIVLRGSDELVLTSPNPQTGARGSDGRIKFTMTPRKGLAPVELWTPERDIGQGGFFKKNHPGNEIVEIVSSPSDATHMVGEARSREPATRPEPVLAPAGESIEPSLRRADVAAMARRMGINPPDESALKTTWKETRDVAAASADKILPSLARANPKRNPLLTDHERMVGAARLKEITDGYAELADKAAAGDAAAKATLDKNMQEAEHLTNILREAGSGLGRGLNLQKALIVDPTDGATVLRRAMAVTDGKLSGLAQRSLLKMADTAGKRVKEAHSRIRAAADKALARLEHADMKTLTVKDILGCR